MASNLRKYKYSGTSSARPNASPDQSASKGPGGLPTAAPLARDMDISDLKSEILLSLKADISAVIKAELRSALAEDFELVKSEVQAVRTEVINGNAALRADVDQVKNNIREIEGGLSACSDDVATLQSTVRELKTELTELKNQCEDMEGRMRRCNVRIFGVLETTGSSSTTSVSKLLAEVLQLEKEPRIDRSHRSLGPTRPGGKPRAIVAKLHYYEDCVEVLRRARTRGPLRFNGAPVAIFPDYTSKVAKARAAFTEVRGLLRGRQGVRYGLLFPARMRITYEGVDKEFTEADKALAYVKTNVIRNTEAGE